MRYNVNWWDVPWTKTKLDIFFLFYHICRCVYLWFLLFGRFREEEFTQNSICQWQFTNRNFSSPVTIAHITKNLSRTEAFQGVLATGDIAQKCGDNPFLIHRQPTKTDRKNGDNLRQRQTIFTFDKAIMDSLCFFRKRSLCHGGCGTGCDSNVVTWQRDSFMTTRQQTITGHYKVNKPFNCCHAVGLLFPAIMSSYKGRLGCWRVTALSVFLRQMWKFIPVDRPS